MDLNLPFRSISVITHKVVVERKPIAWFAVNHFDQWIKAHTVDQGFGGQRAQMLVLQSGGDQGWSHLKAFLSAHLVLGWGVQSSYRVVGCLYVSLSCWSIHVDVLSFLTAWWSQGSLDCVGGCYQENMHTDWPSSWSGQSKAPEPLSCPWNIRSAHCSPRERCLKDTALRESVGVGPRWTEHVIEPAQGSV